MGGPLRLEAGYAVCVSRVTEDRANAGAMSKAQRGACVKSWHRPAKAKGPTHRIEPNARARGGERRGRTPPRL